MGKQGLRDLVVIVSLVNLAFLSIWRELLYSGPSDRYWQPEYTSSAHMAAIVNLVGISMVLWLLSRWIRTSKLWGADYIARFGFLCALVFPLNYLRAALGIGSEALYWLLNAPWLFGTVAIVCGAIGVWLLAAHMKTVSRIVMVIVLVLAPYAALTLGQIALKLVFESDRVSERVNSQGDASLEARRRVVWLMFDELDFRLAFEDRPSFVSLPNFDALVTQSLAASNARGQSQNTSESIPSYTTGSMVRQLSPVTGFEAELTLEDGTVRPWAAGGTIFSDVSKAAIRVGITGYYHPYCRLFSQAVNYCRQSFINTYAPRAGVSVWDEMVAQLIGITPLRNRINGMRTYDDIRRSALATVGDTSLGLVFVHASVPHGPDIFDLATKQFSLVVRGTAGYFGNLILADRLLGELRERMHQTRTWRDTTILITSDHEWRRSRNYDGIRTDKVPFLVKLAGQQEPWRYAKEFTPQKMVRPLVTTLLAGELTDPADLARWLDTRASNQP